MSCSSPVPGVASGPVSARSSVPAAARSSSTNLGATGPATVTLIGKNELESIRAHNRILRANNVSIFKQRNELEARAVAAEREFAVERERRKKGEGAIRQGGKTVARLMREVEELREKVKAAEKQQ
jgi:FtsZ-binding cell division protein ZapB